MRKKEEDTSRVAKWRVSAFFSTPFRRIVATEEDESQIVLLT